MSKEKRISGKFRKWCHILHRDLSFFFAGVILIYAFSGIMLNHKRDFNSDYSITQKEYGMIEATLVFLCILRLTMFSPKSKTITANMK